MKNCTFALSGNGIVEQLTNIPRLTVYAVIVILSLPLVLLVNLIDTLICIGYGIAMLPAALIDLLSAIHRYAFYR